MHTKSHTHTYRMPLDIQTPKGYTFAFIIQLCIGVVGLSTYCIITTFFMGICAYIYTFISDVEEHFQYIYGNQTNINYAKVTRTLKEEILLHGEIYS